MNSHEHKRQRLCELNIGCPSVTSNTRSFGESCSALTDGQRADVLARTCARAVVSGEERIAKPGGVESVVKASA
eukprot:2819054-Pleurochrysis_carterae.AAC.1